MRMLAKDPADRFPSMEEAVATAGARPLTHDDPSRNQLIALAKTGLTHRIVSQARTPRSPIPRPSRSVPVRIARSPVMVGAVAISLIAIGFVASQMMLSDGNQNAEVVTSTPTPANVASDSVTPTPPANVAKENVPPATPSSPLPQQKTTTPPTSQQRRVETAGAGAPNPVRSPLADHGRPNSQVSSESLTVPPQKTDSTPTIPVLSPPPPVSSTTSNTTSVAPAVSRPATTPAEDITAVIQSYARALAAGDLAAARRIYPGMPNEQRQGLEALWRVGGTMSPTWTVSSIDINGDVATAIVRGSNVVVPGRNQTPQQVPVSLRARLERRNNEWRLLALIN
jgi:hypothetical protein